MASLNVDLDYFAHPKTKRLSRLLGRGSEVLPLKLWCFTGKYFAEAGRLTEISAQELETECQWWGEAGQMIQAMLDANFLEFDPDGKTLVVHDWLDHESHIMAYKERAKIAVQARIRNSSTRSSTRSSTSESSRSPPSSSPSSATPCNEMTCTEKGVQGETESSATIAPRLQAKHAELIELTKKAFREKRLSP